MRIDTKFSLGQEVWMMQGNKPVTLKVLGIKIEITEEEYVIEKRKEKYAVYWNGSLYTYDHTRIFATKQELISSL